MKKNVGSPDKIIRLLAAAVIVILYFTGVLSGLVGAILLILAGVFVVTSLVSFCPIYSIFGMSTAKSQKAEN